jgi:hypothetical protein
MIEERSQAMTTSAEEIIIEEIIHWRSLKGTQPSDTAVVHVHLEYLLDRLSALLAVLAIENAPDIGTVTGIEDAINHGRNLMLAEVRQTIEGAVGL